MKGTYLKVLIKGTYFKVLIKETYFKVLMKGTYFKVLIKGRTLSCNQRDIHLKFLLKWRTVKF